MSAIRVNPVADFADRVADMIDLQHDARAGKVDGRYGMAAKPSPRAI